MMYLCVSFFSILLISCADKGRKQIILPQLTMVDVQVIKSDASHHDGVLIAEEEGWGLIKKAFEEIKWKPGTVTDSQGKEAVRGTFFYAYDENMPERLMEYKVWFHQNGTASIQSNNEKEGNGTLSTAPVKVLKKIFLYY